MDTADWRQYHPFLRNTWHKQITAYVPNHIPDVVKTVIVVPHKSSYDNQKIEDNTAVWKNHDQSKAWK